MPTLVRPYAAFTGIAEGVERLLKETGLDALASGSYAIYGSAVRALWTRESAADVNVAFLTSRRGSALPMAFTLGERVKVASRTYRRCEALIRDADFTVCQAALHDGFVYHDARFFEDVARRVLVVNRVRRRTAMASLLRAYKYTQRGWGIPYVTVVDIAARLPRSIRMPAAAELQRQCGGALR